MLRRLRSTRAAFAMLEGPNKNEVVVDSLVAAILAKLYGELASTLYSREKLAL
jgi:hypothetical protein